jgi:chromosome segregation ATPase
MAQQAQNQAEQWFLRTGGDTVFGPVTPEGLVVWAEQGRVLPGHDVSTDRKKWVPAISLAFLKMQWYVDNGEGDLRGPLNRAAAEALIKSGKVSEQAHILFADDVDLTEPSEEKSKSASEKPSTSAQKALTQRIQELEMQLNERGRTEKPEGNTRTVSQMTQERDALATRITELETLCETLKRNAEKDLRTAEKKMESLRIQNKKLVEQLEDFHARLLLAPTAPAQSDAPADRTLIQDLRDKLAEAEIDYAQLLENLEATQHGRDQLQEQINALGSEQSQLQHTQAIDTLKLEEFHEELHAAQGTNEQLRNVIAQKEAACGELHEQLAQMKEACARSDALLSESAQKHAEVIEHLSKAKQEALQWRNEYANQVKERDEALSLSDAVQRQYSEVLAQTEQTKQGFDQLHLAYVKCVQESEKAQARAAEAEHDFADLLAMANTRDSEYLEKIAELERFSSQSPDKIAKFYADQTAVYQLFQNELDTLGKEQEAERDHLEQLKQMSLKRLDFIQERKQMLTKRLGSSPADMTRLSAREQTTDPAAARIRTEFDNLRFVHERDMHAAADRERELVRKLRMYETEANRLKSLAVDGERFGKQVQDLSDQLHRREHELAEERKVRESERIQFQTNHQALVARIETLEREGRMEAQATQTADSKSSKLASFMRLK